MCFIKGTEPNERCDIHREVEICPEGGVSLGECDEKTTVKSLIKVIRKFPCQIKITDAQFVYRDLSPLKEPSLDAGKAYFESLLSPGEYCGTSGVPNAYNRACAHYHYDENDYEEKIYLPDGDE